MSNIIKAALMLGGLGAVFGALLAVVGRLFSVPEDARKSALRECLPGANCGGCGFAGCDAYAEAVASGSAPVGKCPVGGDAAAQKMADIMGVTVEAVEPLVATVMCRGSLDSCHVRFEYEGPQSCRSASLAAFGDKDCRFSCLGYGDCAVKCPFGAIKVGSDRLARIDASLCQGCGKCVETCPRGVIALVPRKNPVHVVCSALDKGKTVRDHCTSGCIGCGKCARSCDFGALTMQNNLPHIDAEKCVGCMRCADSCPTGALQANEEMRSRAVIRYDRCTGCGSCQDSCRYNAVMGNIGHPHGVIAWNCVGCGQCEDKCPEKCIRMVHGENLRARK